jgi:hypothetical protein
LASALIDDWEVKMRRHVKAISVSTVAVCLALALVLALATQAAASRAVVKSVTWVCIVDGQPVDFVSAPEAARHGIEQANSSAGVVFGKFGEECSVE